MAGAANEFVFALAGVLFVLRGKPDTRAIAGGALGVGLVIFTAAMEAPTRNTRSLRFL